MSHKTRTRTRWASIARDGAVIAVASYLLAQLMFWVPVAVFLSVSDPGFISWMLSKPLWILAVTLDPLVGESIPGTGIPGAVLYAVAGVGLVKGNYWGGLD